MNPCLQLGSELTPKVMQPIYPGDKVFSEILSQAMIPMDVYTVRAFLTGFVMGPDYVPLQFAIDEILLSGSDREVRFPEAHLREQFLSSLAGLWNEISEYKVSSLRRVRPLPEAFDNFDYLVAYMNSLCEDAALFIAALDESGLGLDDQSWSEERVESALEELEAFLAQAEHFLDALKRKRLRSKTDFSKLVRELCVFHDVWENSYGEIVSVLRTMRMTGKSPRLSPGLGPILQASTSNIAQATCSCGSGKTFRECCMLKLVN